MENIQLEQRITGRFAEEPALRGAQVTAAEQDGVVVLRGSAPSFAARQVAESHVRDAGADRVRNEVVVTLPDESRREDRELRKAIRNFLKWNAQIHSSGIEVSVEDGVVTLEGEVDWPYQKSAAEAAVVPFVGVRGVIDRLEVRPRVRAAEVEREIRDALHREAEIDADRVHVTVAGGRVVLRGTVRTSAEVVAVEAAARSVAGVEDLESHLRSEEGLASV